MFYNRKTMPQRTGKRPDISGSHLAVIGNMTTITHIFNQINIAQLSADTTIGGFDIPKGYVNATQMCKGLEYSGTSRKTPQGGRPSVSYSLTLTCFKELAMLAKTAQGKQVRLYFIECEKIAKQAISKPAPEPTAPPIALLPGDIRLDSMIKNLDRLELDLLNPRFKQGLQDLAADMLGISNPALKGEITADQEGVWCGVVERAEQLGYPVGFLIEKRTALGRWVAKSKPALDSQKEVRLCNGTQRPINVYRVTDELDGAIVAYFDKLAARQQSAV